MYKFREIDDDKITIELRDKIKSKMDVAKFFSGFVSIFLGLSFKEVIPKLTCSNYLICIPAWVGVSCILLSIAFAIITLFAFDGLLMPPELWDHKLKENLNKSLEKKMIEAWRWLFLPSIFCFLFGILGFLIAMTTYILLPILICSLIVIAMRLSYKRLRIG